MNYSRGAEQWIGGDDIEMIKAVAALNIAIERPAKRGTGIQLHCGGANRGRQI